MSAVDRAAHRLRVAFVVGAITDALALFPMLVPHLTTVLWGIDAPAPILATGYGASLMAGWTGLLLWAARRPVERRFVAPLTLGVILGLVATEILAVRAGDVALVRMAPTFVLQAGLTVLFGAGWLGVGAPADGPRRTDS